LIATLAHLKDVFYAVLLKLALNVTSLMVMGLIIFRIELFVGPAIRVANVMGMFNRGTARLAARFVEMD
jgi:hypothetical protein